MENLLNRRDCDEILENLLKTKQFHVEDFKIYPIIDEYPGFLGDYFRLTIDYCDENNQICSKYFFAKTLPIKNMEKKKLIEDLGIFKKEYLLYKHLIPELKKYSAEYKWCPECCLSRDNLIVLEDLKIDGYKSIPIREDFSQIHIHEALKSVAVCHASSIAYETLELKPTGTSIGEKYKDMLFETAYFKGSVWYDCLLEGLKTVALEKTKYGIGSKYENLIRAEFFDKLNDIYRIVDEKTPSKVPKVWAIRDTWKNNLMFKFESENDLSKPSHCMLIDFQISRYLPLTVDVLILIILCTRASHHKQFMEHYLEFYYGKLTEELAKHNLKIENLCTWADFKESCDDVMMLPKMMNALFMTSTHLEDGILRNLSENDPAEYHRIMMVDRGEFNLQNMEKDPIYNDFVVESAEELIEYLFEI